MTLTTKKGIGVRISPGSIIKNAKGDYFIVYRVVQDMVYFLPFGEKRHMMAQDKMQQLVDEERMFL